MSEIIPIFDEASAESLYAQVYQYFREEILKGRIAAQTRLPSVRHLSQSIGVSKVTVETAYQQLVAEGYLESRARSGFYVREVEVFAEESPVPTKIPPLPLQLNSHSEHQYNFHNTTIDVDRFPHAIWRKCLAEALERYPEDFARYGDKQGEYELRCEIANYLRRVRTVNCVPEQIILGTGLLQALGLLSLIVRPFVKRVAIEEPGYDDARVVFEQHGLEVVPIPLEEDGIDVERLRQSGAQMVYVTPSHQYPQGMVMPIAKRMKLLEWAKTTGGFLLENDYDGEFRYNTKPTPSLQGLDGHGSVVFVSDFSKSFSPALRMNYLVLPPKLLESFGMVGRVYYCPVSRLQQRTMQIFMTQGFWEKHLRKMRNVYERKHRVLVQVVKEYLGQQVEILAQQAGLHIVLELKTEYTEAELVRLAAEKDVKVYPVENNWINRAAYVRPRILLGFGGLTEAEIRVGVGLLKEAWFGERVMV